MKSIKVASMAPRKTELPPFTQAYELTASILQSLRINDCKRAAIKLTRLVNIDEVVDIHAVKVFSRFVEFHTQKSKISNKVYQTLLDKGWTTMSVLRPKLASERQQVASLEAIRDELEPVCKQAKPKRLQVIKDFEELGDSDDRHARNVKSTDAMFLRSIKKTDTESLGFGESGVIVRSIAMLQTMISEVELRKISTLYGIQRLSGIYILASHARLVGASVEEGDTVVDAKREASAQLKFFNKTSKVQYEMTPMDPVNCSDHYYWLLFPTDVLACCRLAKFGKWDFVERPKASDARLVD